MAALLLGGCASIPDITVSYRPVTWALLVTVAHTVTCNRAGSQVIVERGASFLPIYAAGPADQKYQIRLSELDRFYADADISVTLTEDGRLKAINQSSTGQGEAIAKSAIAAAATLSSVPLVAAAALPLSGGVSLFSHNVFKGQVKEAAPLDVCGVVRKYSIAGPDQLPQVSLVQTAFIKPDSPVAVGAKPSADQKPLLDELKTAKLDLAASVTLSLGADELQPIAHPRTEVASAEVALTLQRMIALTAAVADVQGALGSKSIAVPTPKVFVLPVPKAALFGKQSFSLALADSGRITNIGYGRTSGVASALGAAAAVAGAETTEDSIEAAAMKAAADLIAQQQRYNNCKLKPAECK